MTNNPTIDGVSRELLQRAWGLLDESQPGRTCNELRAVLDAPAVERQELKPYPDRLCHIDYTAHPYLCGCLRDDDEAQRIFDEHAVAALQSTISRLEARIAELESGLGGMLFAFDDGVGRGWSEKLLDYARQLTPAVEFDATAALNNKPSTEVKS